MPTPATSPETIMAAAKAVAAGYQNVLFCMGYYFAETGRYGVKARLLAKEFYLSDNQPELCLAALRSWFNANTTPAQP